MKQTTLAGKLLSPAGFAFVLICFLLPFVTLSCGASADKITSTFTGVDMVVGTGPDYAGVGIDSDARATLDLLMQDQYDIEPLAILAVLAVVLGMATVFISERLARHSIGSGLGALVLALLIAAEIRAIDTLEQVRGSNVEGYGGVSDPGIATPRYGFWLAVTTAALLMVGHGYVLVRAWRSPAPVATEPAEAA